MEEKVLLKVEGMDCANCAQTINRTLSKEGFKDVSVDFLTGEVIFNQPGQDGILHAVGSIRRLGYRVAEPKDHLKTETAMSTVSPVKGKFLVSLIFTIPLFFHMILPFPVLHNPVLQLFLCLPVMYIGISHFGRSAWYSVRAGVPNMDVLIFIGSTSAFIYSATGLVLHYGTPAVSNFLFFETAATIITLVLLGNLIEQRSVRQTTSAITQLGMLQPQIAMKVVTENGDEKLIVCEASELKKGDVAVVNTGDRIPADGKISSGAAAVDESMLSGESIPVTKKAGDTVTGGTLVADGSIRFIVEQTGNETRLSRIIELVKSAQHSKPEIQKLGDRISAIFVPAVLAISLLTFCIYFFLINASLAHSLMTAIAVLVISCPCAMGLATPTAVMVGLGRAARNGILIKGGSTIEQLSSVQTVVFDKTGTLTTGKLKIRNIQCLDGSEQEIRELLYSLEKNSSHPVALSLQKELAGFTGGRYIWKSVQEDKGIGINATDEKGDLYSAGSFQMVKHFYHDLDHEIYLLKNNKLMATVDLEDEVKPGVSELISNLKKEGKRVVLLSGDRKKNCESVAARAGIEEIYFEKLPADKLIILDKLVQENPTAMVGDGVNDAPALARATVGISISDASQVAIQSSQVIVLAGDNPGKILDAFRLGRLTYKTIRQNLFWAFIYNIIAIPVAAAGMLSPMIGALSMAFSDIFVIGNSLRLKSRAIR